MHAFRRRRAPAEDFFHDFRPPAKHSVPAVTDSPRALSSTLSRRRRQVAAHSPKLLSPLSYCEDQALLPHPSGAKCGFQEAQTTELRSFKSWLAESFGSVRQGWRHVFLAYFAPGQAVTKTDFSSACHLLRYPNDLHALWKELDHASMGSIVVSPAVSPAVATELQRFKQAIIRRHKNLVNGLLHLDEYLAEEGVSVESLQAYCKGHLSACLSRSRATSLLSHLTRTVTAGGDADKPEEFLKRHLLIAAIDAEGGEAVQAYYASLR